MVTQLTRLVVPLVLFTLLASSADAQDEEGFKGSPTDFLPLQVGNKWTYQHWYSNGFYKTYEIVEGVVRGPFGYKADPLGPDWMFMRAIAEIPGYPLTDRYEWESPLFDLRYCDGCELTLEITHTETIEGHTYFVFSKPEYDWPPPPPLFLAGQKVRFSDAGVLLIRRQEQDIPLYDFAPPYIEKHYTTPEYPMRDDESAPIMPAIEFSRVFRDVRRPEDWGLGPNTPLGQAFITIFDMNHPFLDLRLNTSNVYFVKGYGIALYILHFPGLHFTLDFQNTLYPVSAVIGGKRIEYPEVRSEWWWTSVQPTSWGQLKARHGQEP